MTIAKELANDTLTLTLEGRLDTITAPEIEHATATLDGVDKLVIDFAKIDYISSAGLRVLLSLQKRMASKDGMVVRNVQPMVLEVLEMSGFVDILTIE